MDLHELISRYIPAGPQEQADRRMMLRYMDTYPDVLTRDNEAVHFTASAWITDPEREHVLMIYHNIYDSWAWTGGHADGDPDLLAVALREAREESGLTRVHSASPDPLSIEILPVNSHFKRGKFVVPHLHLNVTYHLIADMSDELKVRPEENSAVRWFPLADAVAASSERAMHSIYEKLNERVLRREISK